MILGFGGFLKSGGSKVKSGYSKAVSGGKIVGGGVLAADRFLGRASQPPDMREGAQKAMRAAVKYSFLGFMINIFMRILLVFVWIFLFVLAILVIIFVYRLVATGSGDFYLEHGQAYFVDTSAPAVAKTGLAGIWDKIWNPYKPVSDVGFDIEKGDTTKKYIKIEEAQPQKKIYSSGEKDIIVYARGSAHSLSKDTDGEILCELEDYDEKIETRGEISLIGEKEEDIFVFECVFVDGVKAKESEGIASYSGSAGVRYNNVAESEWRAWTVSSSKKDKDILELIDDPHLSRSGKRESIAIGDTPMQIGFGIGDDQPYTEAQSYILHIGLEKANLADRGNLNMLHNLWLYLPENVETSDDMRYCEFEKTDEGVYRLRKEALDYYNKDCSRKGLVGIGMSSADCIRNFKDEIIASCTITFDVDEESNIPSFVDFRAVAEYSYDIKKSFVVDVLSLETTAKVVCSGDSSETCNQKGCRFINGRCSACPDEWRSCNDYSESICNNDPCHFGGCILEGTECNVGT